ncbi:MAG: hypothetical protein ACP5HT_05065 [Conexivisphaera sp.]
MRSPASTRRQQENGYASMEIEDAEGWRRSDVLALDPDLEDAQLRERVRGRMEEI